MPSFSTLQFPWIGKRRGGVEACLLDAQHSEVISIWTRISGGRRPISFIQLQTRPCRLRNVNRRSYSRQEFRNFGSPICLIPDRLLEFPVSFGRCTDAKLGPYAGDASPVAFPLLGSGQLRNLHCKVVYRRGTGQTCSRRARAFPSARRYARISQHRTSRTPNRGSSDRRRADHEGARTRIQWPEGRRSRVLSAG